MSDTLSNSAKPNMDSNGNPTDGRGAWKQFYVVHAAGFMMKNWAILMADCLLARVLRTFLKIGSVLCAVLPSEILSHLSAEMKWSPLNWSP